MCDVLLQSGFWCSDPAFWYWWCLSPKGCYAARWRLVVRVHTDTVSASFGLNQPASEHGHCSPSNVTLSQNDCQTYFTCQTVVQAVIYLYDALFLSRHQQVWQAFQIPQLLLSAGDINNRDSCSVQSGVCALWRKQAYYLSKGLFSNIPKGKFFVTVTTGKKSTCRNLLAIEISDSGQRWTVTTPC